VKRRYLQTARVRDTCRSVHHAFAHAQQKTTAAHHVHAAMCCKGGKGSQSTRRGASTPHPHTDTHSMVPHHQVHTLAKTHTTSFVTAASCCQHKHMNSWQMQTQTRHSCTDEGLVWTNTALSAHPHQPLCRIQPQRHKIIQHVPQCGHCVEKHFQSFIVFTRADTQPAVTQAGCHFRPRTRAQHVTSECHRWYCTQGKPQGQPT
jgi:hypothetical protein